MKWQLEKKSLTKGNYRITNFGEVGGDQYCLWKLRKNVFVKEGKSADCYCQLVTMGSSAYCKEVAKNDSA